MTEPKVEKKLPTPFKTAFRFALILLSVTVILELSKYFTGWGNSDSSDEGAIYLIYDDVKDTSRQRFGRIYFS